MVRKAARSPTAAAQHDHRPSGLILDLVIEAGDPADSERLLPMLSATSRFMAGRRGGGRRRRYAIRGLARPRPAACTTWRPQKAA